MTTRVDGGLLPDLKRFGATDISACFSCGVCSATCPLSTDAGAFPRRIFRYAQLGMKDRLLSSRELWLCYGCAECTESCPQQADPAEFMAAARRYAVASYDRTRIARMLATSRAFALAFVVLPVGLLAAFMYTAHGPASGQALALFDFIPSGLIHNLGVAVMVVFGLGAIAGLVEMVRRVFRAPTHGPSTASLKRVPDAVWYSVARESLGQARFRQDCADGTETQPWYLQRWLLHAATMWGFLGLLLATMLDYGLELLGIKPTGTPVPIWYPVRALGTIAGLALVYGTTVLAWRRLRHSDRASKHSGASDWTFLSLLWIAGVTGFVLELGLYLPAAPTWGYAVFLIHVAVAMALVLLAPFGKFAHAFYRPVALFAFRLRG